MREIFALSYVLLYALIVLQALALLEALALYGFVIAILLQGKI